MTECYISPEYNINDDGPLSSGAVIFRAVNLVYWAVKLYFIPVIRLKWGHLRIYVTSGPIYGKRSAAATSLHMD